MATASQQPIRMLTGLGLLTTVAQLPPKFRNRYLNLHQIKIENPLDLSVKQTFSSSFSHSSSSLSSSSPNPSPIPEQSVPITPPPSPLKRKHTDSENDSESTLISIDFPLNPEKIIKTEVHLKIEKSTVTPKKPIKNDSAPCTLKASPNVIKSGKNKATRKLKFDEDTSSPVSGTIIRPLEEVNDLSMQYSNGDIDPKYNIVEVTEEAKAELAAIKNVIGEYICKLCRIKFDDAFELARHRCSCIVLLEYRCPECGKKFNCPANLASHRRWHKPKKDSNKKDQLGNENEQQFSCEECGKLFKRQAYLRKHLLTHSKRHQNDCIDNSQDSNSKSFDTQSLHSGNDNDQQTVIKTYHFDLDSRSDCSSPGQLQIIEHEHTPTEEENIAAAALTNLRNCTSVIQHTTIAMAH